MTEGSLDLVIKNVRLRASGHPTVEPMDLGVKDGRFAQIEREIPVNDAREVFDAKDRLAFPGLVDPHMHTGIYSPLAEDAVTESRAAARAA